MASRRKDEKTRTGEEPVRVTRLWRELDDDPEYEYDLDDVLLDVLLDEQCVDLDARTPAPDLRGVIDSIYRIAY